MWEYDNTKKNFFQVKFENCNIFNNCNFSVNFNTGASGTGEFRTEASEESEEQQEDSDNKSDNFLLTDNLNDKNLEENKKVVKNKKRNLLSVCDERFKLSKECELDWDLAEDEEEDINDSENKFLPFKLQTLRLEKVYQYLKKFDRAEKLHNCSTYLWFELKRGQTIDKKKLKRINSCKLRLCPFCQWRKSLKTFANILRCVQEIERRDKHKHNDDRSRFITWTLTTENVKLEALAEEFDKILKGFNVLRQRKDFKSAFEGYVRSVEVVVDRDERITLKRYSRAKEYYIKRNISVGDLNPNYMKCNVHIHILLHTRYSIYTKENYITQEKLTKMWREILELDYKPIVWVKSFGAKNKNTKGRELAEFAKYTVKSNNYLRYNYKSSKSIENFVKDREFILDSKVIFYLDKAMASRRLFAMGGSFRKISKELKLDYENFDSEDFSDDLETFVIGYCFNFIENFYLRERI